jgi:ribonuclease HI
MEKELIVFCDGGAQNNPGPAGIGVVFCDAAGNVFKKISRYIGRKTNNQAEYEAVILGLKEVKKMKVDHAQFYLDSELVVEQINHRYKIKNEGLAPLFIQVHNLKMTKPGIKFSYIPRTKNSIADSLVKKAIKNHV